MTSRHSEIWRRVLTFIKGSTRGSCLDDVGVFDLQTADCRLHLKLTGTPVGLKSVRLA